MKTRNLTVTYGAHIFSCKSNKIHFKTNEDLLWFINDLHKTHISCEGKEYGFIIFIKGCMKAVGLKSVQVAKLKEAV